MRCGKYLRTVSLLVFPTTWGKTLTSGKTSEWNLNNVHDFFLLDKDNHFVYSFEIKKTRISEHMWSYQQKQWYHRVSLRKRTNWFKEYMVWWFQFNLGKNSNSYWQWRVYESLPPTQLTVWHHVRLQWRKLL